MLILLGMASCNRLETEEEEPKVVIPCDRTVLVYMAADNNLASYHQSDIEEMLKKAGDIPENCRLLVYVDDASLPRIISIEQKNGKSTQKTQQQYSPNGHAMGKREQPCQQLWTCPMVARHIMGTRKVASTTGHMCRLKIGRKLDGDTRSSQGISTISTLGLHPV